MTVYDQVAEKLRERPYTCEELIVELGRPKGSIQSALQYFKHHRRFRLATRALPSRERGSKVLQYWLAEDEARPGEDHP